MIKKRVAPRPLSAAVQIILASMRLELLSMLPELVAVGLVGSMTLMFLMVLADVACLEAPNFVVVTQ